MSRDSRQLSQASLRLRTLATAEPIHRACAAGGTAFAWVDNRDLCLHALGRLLDSWSLGSEEGVLGKEALARVIAERVREQALVSGETPDGVAAREHGHRIVDVLLNSADRSSPFSTRVFDAEANRFDRYSFRLLQECESEDNSFHLEPTAEASNLYFQSFLVDVQDVLEGQRHALDNHIRNGRTDKLAAEAERHRLLAARLKTHLRTLTRRAERSIRAVSPTGEVVPLLNEVTDTARMASDFDKDIMVRLREHEHIAEGDALMHIDRTKRAINKARDLFLQVKRDATVMLASLEEAAQAAACRPARRGMSVPDLDEDVGVPLMSAPSGGDLGEDIIAAMCGAAIPEGMVPDMVRLAQSALPPAVPRREIQTPDDPSDFEVPPAPSMLRFGEAGSLSHEAQAFVREHGHEAGSLGGLLRRPDARRRGDAFGEAVALIVAAAFKDQGGSRDGSVRLAGLSFRATGRPIPGGAAVLGTDIAIEASP